MFHRKRASNPVILPPRHFVPNDARPVSTLFTVINTKSSLSTQHASAPPSLSAQTAAAQAFLASRVSNASLSSAAAATALRSHATSPAPVSGVQTPRTIRRQASNASSGSGGGSLRGPGGPGLHRKSSSGSMTERTFREPSPNRGPSRAPAADAPPVPALPTAPLIPTKSHRRTASLDPLPRVTSPIPDRAGRGSSLDRAPAPSIGQIAARRAAGLASVQEHELERAGSRGSVNFSLPTVARSPTASPTGERRLTSPTSAQQRMFSSLGPGGIPRDGSATYPTLGPVTASQTPAKPKKKKKAAASPERMEMTDAAAPRLVPAPRASASSSTGLAPPIGAAPPKKKKKKVSPSPMTPQEGRSNAPGLTFYNPENGDEDASDQTHTFKTRAGALLSKQPSVVREDRELEEREEGSPLTDPRPRPKGSASVTPQAPPIGVPQAPTAIKKKKKKAAVTTPVNGTAAGGPLAPPSRQPPTLSATDIPLGPGMGRGAGSVQGRPQSLSPSRVAHFTSDAPVTSPNIPKHQPPPRSVSPAKSAMKQSPSRRAGSPADSWPSGTNRGSVQAPSETSETSMITDEGSRERDATQAKKKRAARVSFDATPTIVTNGANSPGSPVSHQMLSPQHKETSKRWSGLLPDRSPVDRSDAATGTATAAEEEAGDEVLEPLPTLPSFGSVRQRKSRDEGDEQNDKYLRDPPSAPATITSTPPTSEGVGMPTDQVIGGILANDLASERPPSMKAPVVDDHLRPLPPQVTSVEGSGQVSDEESLYSNEGASDPSHPVETTVPLKGVTAGSDEQAVEDEAAVPSIALQEPTPTLDKAAAQEDYLGAANRLSEGEPTPASTGIAEPTPEGSAIHQHDAGLPVVGEVAEVLRQQTDPVDEEEDSSDESDEANVFTDAAEDLQTVDGDGFQSIDAVVESPVRDTRPGLAITTPPESPIASSHARRPVRVDGDRSEPAAEEGWGRAQAYWSSLSDGRREEMERAALPVTPEVVVVQTSKAKPKKKKKKAPPPGTLVSPAGREDPALPPWPDEKYHRAIKQRNREGMKSTMRPASAMAPPTTFLAPSLRNGSARLKTKPHAPLAPLAPPAMEGKAGRSSLKKNRPASAPVPAPQSTVSAAVAKELRNMNVPTSGIGAKPISNKAKKPEPTRVTSMLVRTRSDGSESSASASSFRKRRTPTAPGAEAGAGYRMRRSMRGSSQPAGLTGHRRPGSPGAFNAPNRSSRFSLRSLSPTGSTTWTPPGPLAQGTLRSSLRGSVDSGVSAARSVGKTPPKKPPSRFAGFGRSSKAKVQAEVATSMPADSRFDDSSDDEDVRRTFRSRYSDSSDDDVPPAAVGLFTPVRGIPRRIGEEDGDSTELSDSSAGDRSPSSQPKPTAVRRSHEGAALATGSLRSALALDARPVSGAGLVSPGIGPSEGSKKKKKKRSFFGTLGRRKDPSKVQKPTGESGARLDTPLERSQGEIQKTRNAAPSSPISSVRPRLMKKPTANSTIANSATPNGTTANGATPMSWPLPPTINDGPRPTTSDGTVGAKAPYRPDMGNRRSTAFSTVPTHGAAENTPAVGKEKEKAKEKEKEKKKKFPRLRRAFGLHD
ncbi:MAG: hypothetical protein M1838_004189 [Thelocarpon superellum]|nr:MAG: hypothetical protein M1838_004189 [Thelocarpon superellum]